MMPLDARLLARAEEVVRACSDVGARLVVVEASTGGLATGVLTLVPGASAVLDCALVPYSHDSKCRLLALPVETFTRHGSVSEEAARAMAERGLAIAPDATVSIAITGVEGPSGGTVAKPVGLVHFAAAKRVQARTLHEVRELGSRSRDEIRRESIDLAFQLVLRRLRED